VGIDLRRVKRPAKRGYLNLTVVDASEIKESQVYDNFDEGYLLNIGVKGVDIKATTAAGLYYALQTLRQMCHERHTLAACQICDAPRFEYRGVLIDISRHFRSVEFLKRQIDAMAELKMNRLHLHLTDAAGWRIEV
jgi:hexosaminidase